VAQPILWAGVDAGKAAHHCVAINADGQRMLSRRVVNDEAALIDLIRAVKELAGDGTVRWAIDLNSGGAALMITLLLADGQDLLYIPGRTVHHASGAYRGDGKTDAKDAAIIADQARMRKDLHPFRHGDKTAVDLRILCARRTDLADDRRRAINRLRAQLLEYFPALERAFDFAHRKGALTLLTGYQTPDGLRRMGAARLEKWLRDRHVWNADDIATRAIEAAYAQRTTVIGQAVAASVVARLAQTVLDLNGELADLDATIEATFQQHRLAPIITSMPGFGHLLGPNLSLRPMAISPASVRPTGSLASPASHPSRVTPDALAATSNGHAGTTAACCESSTWPPTTASKPAPNHETTTTASDPRANATPSPCCASHDGASTSYGPCNATTPATSPDYHAPLDNLIETQSDVLLTETGRGKAGLSVTNRGVVRPPGPSSRFHPTHGSFIK
jgi:Transposase